VRLDVSAKYETFNRYNSQLKAYDTALSKGLNSYNETIRDYRLGLGTNLDAFTSLNLFLSSKRNAERTKIQALMTHKLLEASAGVLP
jgi:outer membrane protein TolC